MYNLRNRSFLKELDQAENRLHTVKAVLVATPA